MKTPQRTVVFDRTTCRAEIVDCSEHPPESHVVLAQEDINICRQIVLEASDHGFSISAYLDWRKANTGLVFLGTDFVAGEHVSVTVLANSKADAIRLLFPDEHPPAAGVSPKTAFAKEFRPTVNLRVIHAAGALPRVPLYASRKGGLDFLPREMRKQALKRDPNSYWNSGPYGKLGRARG